MGNINYYFIAFFTLKGVGLKCQSRKQEVVQGTLTEGEGSVQLTSSLR